MRRRGILSLLGMAGAAGVTPQSQIITRGYAGSPLNGVAAVGAVEDAGDYIPGISSDSKDGKERRRKWRLFDLQNANSRRRRRRREIEIMMLGGHHPHIYSHQSAAPWFKAMVSARHLEAYEDGEANKDKSLREMIFGKDPE